MATRIERRARGWSLTRRLVVALTIGAFFVAVLLGFLGADRDNQRTLAARAELEQKTVMSLAERAAPLLERRDVMRLSVLAAVARDEAGGRVLVLDRDGHVVIDTALVAGDRQQTLSATTGPSQRVLDSTSEPMRESAAAIRFGGEMIGEMRLQCPLDVTPSLLASFDLTWFGLVLLSCLTLVAAAAMLGHHWSTRVRGATDALVRLAAGEVAGESPGDDVDSELTDLGSAMRELERGLNDGLERVGEAFATMALQVIDSLEKRRLVAPGHGERTARLASRLADRLNLLEEDRAELETACRLVDLGKASLRPGLLNKQSPLTDEEARSFASHPLRAAEQLECVRPLRRVAKILRHQLERYDGRGTPDGLRGDRLPLGSRVLALAAAFDLLTCCGSDKVLRWDEALERIESAKGDVFDPWLVELFCEEIRRDPPLDDRREVRIVPAGTMPWHVVDASDEVDDDDGVLQGELEVMRDDFPFEEQS